MRVPCRWLAEYVDIGVGEDESVHGIERVAEQLAERLTMAGLEVEEIIPTGRLTGVVVGRVIESRPHPRSDHLSLCRLDLGKEEVEVVCGATNVVVGATVPVATVGGELPNGLRITERKLRGTISRGMILSKEELGLEERSTGIWNFDRSLDLALGTDLASLLEYDDIVLDITVTSNRPDCTGIYGIAREAAAITGKPLRPLACEFDESLPSVGESYTVEVEDSGDAPRYTARLMSGITVAPSPLWMQHRLAKAGMRPLSNVVDVTNYVMLELGRPLHPFDADLVREQISIRRARRDERFQTLDGIERSLTEDVLMITDLDGGLAIAGVMGGERSEISPQTTRVLLEAAAFDQAVIRCSSRAIGLRSEASLRFERLIDFEGVPRASARAAHLLQRLTGCRVHQGLVDSTPIMSPPVLLSLSPTRVTSLLGIDLDRAELREILGRLEISTVEAGEDLTATIPSFRTDLVREVDLIEEIGRIYGYDRFPSTPPQALLCIGKKDPVEICKDRVREILTGLGLSEVVTDGFDKTGWRQTLLLSDDDLVAVRNPMISGQRMMRGSLLPGILSVVETNLNQHGGGGMIFEVGRVFSRTHGEREAIAVALFGRTGMPLQGKEEVDLAAAKGILTNLLTGLNLKKMRIATDSGAPFLHPGRGGAVIGERESLGPFGELAQEISSLLSAAPRVIVFELDLDRIRRQAGGQPAFSPLPRYPSSKRDLSLLCPLNLPEEEIGAAIRSEEMIESALLYDLYHGEQVKEEEKSLTYEISLRAPGRTLTDREIGEVIDRVEARLKKLGASVRS